jgi:phosphatidylglycerophosphate synthase
MSHHVRDHRSLLAAAEKRLLIWLANRLPHGIHSDHLTGLALAGMALAALGYAGAARDPRLLGLAVAGLAVNWFGDSLDGTLARVRGAERPRYGFYVDHVVDILGATLLFGGLALSPLMSPVAAIALLAAYLLVSAEIYLATVVRGVFQMSFAGIGPTELRILLAIGTVVFGARLPVAPGGGWTPFDLGGIVAAAGLVAITLVNAVRNTRTLADAEPRPAAVRTGTAEARSTCCS